MSRAFLHAAAACWIASSLTTLCLIFLPRFITPAPDFEARVRLVHDPVYMARLWIGFVHPLIVLGGAMGVKAVRRVAAAGGGARRMRPARPLP